MDRRLYAYDIQGSVAHCRALAKASIITDAEAAAIIKGLEKIREEIEDGGFRYDDSLEDIHMHIESRLFDISGPVARKLHTARSRNDQIALDVRMYLRVETAEIIHRLHRLQKIMVALARRHLDAILPGYTHLQRAQPILLSHHLMAYYEMFARDVARFQDCLGRINVMPLGCAALAGTGYPIDRKYTAELLRFDAVSANSFDLLPEFEGTICGELQLRVSLSLLSKSGRIEEVRRVVSHPQPLAQCRGRYLHDSFQPPVGRNYLVVYSGV